MGRDLKYYFTDDEPIGDRFRASEMEQLPQFRNYCCSMSRVFTYSELMEYIKTAAAEEEWETVEALSHIMNLWGGDYVLIENN